MDRLAKVVELAELFRTIDRLFWGGASPKDTSNVLNEFIGLAWDTLNLTDRPEDAWYLFAIVRSRVRKMSVQDSRLLCETECGIAIATARMGDRQEALHACAQAERTARDADGRRMAAVARVITLDCLGDEEEARREASRIPEGAYRAGALPPPSAAIGDRGDPSRASATRAHVYLLFGQTRMALSALDSGIHSVERRRRSLETEQARTALLSSHLDPYAAKFDLLVRTSMWRKAFWVSEQMRARSYLDFVQLARRPKSDFKYSSAPEWYDCHRDELEKLEAEKRPDDLKSAARDDLLAELWIDLLREQKEALVSTTVEAKRPVPIGRLRDCLREAELLVEYQSDGARVCRFLVTRSGFSGSRLSCASKDLQEAATALPEMLRNARRDAAGGSHASFDSYFEWMGKPLLRGIPLDGVNHLIVVPPHELEGVPFGSMRVQGRYLAEHCAVTIAPSASVHASLAARAADAPPPDRCMFVMDPTRSLTHVEAEANVLHARFGQQLRVLPGEKAERRLVTGWLTRFPVIHFATHGGYMSRRPEFSYLRLAGTQRLFASDLLRLDLRRAPVVVLTTCESGKGDHSRAGEMLGLPRSFLRAGARAVVAPLWPLDDHGAIALFVDEFYAHLASAGPARACQMAQRRCLGEGHPPSVWASFAAFGA